MSFLIINNLQVGYGNELILEGIDLQVAKGEMIALLGPSGCGKTTLLNALCGFLDTSGGTISVNGRELTHLPPEQREMAMVFQSYALWPHMNVQQNIAYGLKVRGMDRHAIAARVAETLALVNLSGYQQRAVTSLSGGQRQRVALGRALAIHPPILLLDEPLSNLDARIRLSVRHEIKSLQKKLGFTSIMVTHDREEAMVMADRIIVLNQGKIEQAGTPQEIYQQPATPFVADFMGADNRLQLDLQRTGETLSYQRHDLTLQLNRLSDSAFPPASGPVELFFRSEAVKLHTDKCPTAPDGLQMTGIIEQCAYLGNSYRHTVRCGDQKIQADHPQPLAEACLVTLHVPEPALHIF